MISQPQDKGIGNKKFDYPLVKGKKYKIVKLGLREGQIRVNETFFKGKNYTESYQKKQYLIGEIKILEVKGVFNFEGRLTT
jgi:hypothetical protein